SLTESPHAAVLTQRREQAALLSLLLKAQRDGAVGALERSVEIGLVCHARWQLPAPPRERHERRRSRERDARAERYQGVDVRARDAAVQYIADDDDPLPLQISERAPKGIRVEQPLRRVRVPPVAGVDDGGVAALRDEVRRTRRCVSHHDDVTAERVQRPHGVEERFALL